MTINRVLAVVKGDVASPSFHRPGCRVTGVGWREKLQGKFSGHFWVRRGGEDISAS